MWFPNVIDHSTATVLNQIRWNHGRIRHVYERDCGSIMDRTHNGEGYWSYEWTRRKSRSIRNIFESVQLFHYSAWSRSKCTYKFSWLDMRDICQECFEIKVPRESPSCRDSVGTTECVVYHFPASHCGSHKIALSLRKRWLALDLPHVMPRAPQCKPEGQTSRPAFNAGFRWSQTSNLMRCRILQGWLLPQQSLSAWAMSFRKDLSKIKKKRPQDPQSLYVPLKYRQDGGCEGLRLLILQPGVKDTQIMRYFTACLNRPASSVRGSFLRLGKPNDPGCRSFSREYGNITGRLLHQAQRALSWNGPKSTFNFATSKARGNITNSRGRCTLYRSGESVWAWSTIFHHGPGLCKS